MERKKILIVEDERLIAEDIRRTLVNLDYDIVALISEGEIAVEKARELVPDLVLMDIMLEGEMDGIEAAEQIHRELDIPIIFLTAYSNEKTLSAATTAEPFGYILKPFEERELYATVEMAIYKHKTQKTLKENEKKYRDIFENANEAICIIQDEKLKFLNPQTAKYLDQPREYLLSRKFLDFVHPDDQNKISALFSDILTENNVKQMIDFRLISKNGTIKWMKSNIVLIHWENHPAILNFMSDVTEKIQAEEEIKKFKVISENANYGITITDLNSDIIYINKYYAEIHGYQPVDLIGRNISTFHNQDQMKELQELNVKLEDTGSFSAVELWHTHVNGTVFPMLMNGIMIRDKSGQQQFIAASAIDITDRKRSEKIQNELFAELEHVNNELQNFAYVVSHDLKAPLRAISTLANWISSDYADKFDAEGKEQMVLLISRVKRMHDLIDGILEYSRVGRIKEEKIPLNLDELLQEVIDAIAPPDNIEIIIENDLPEIIFERTRIIQVFQNLLSNAIKFLDKPKGLIKIGSKEYDEYWKFWVSDNGPGIDRKHFTKIFKIFQTLQPRDEFESTGIGLTLIKKIIDLYEGKIWLESELNEGSTFFFTLPKNTGQYDDPADLKQPEKSQENVSGEVSDEN